MNDVSVASEQMWGRLPKQLPSMPTQPSGEPVEIESIEQLPSMWAMYRAILLRRTPRFDRDQTIPTIAAETTLTVSPDWISHYRELCGLPSAPPDAPLPLTVPQVFAAPLHTYLLIHPRFPISALGVVHAANEMIATRPLRAQEAMRIRVWVGETRWKTRGVEFDFHTAVFTEGHSDPAWLGRTVIFRSIKTKRERDPSSANRAPELILDGETQPLKLSADLGRRYAPIAGDYNPIHLYPLTARLFGFKRPIVHGMWTLAYVMSRLVTGQDDTAPLSTPPSLDTGVLSVRFRRPLFLPSEAQIIKTSIHEGWGVHVLDQRKKLAIEVVLSPQMTSTPSRSPLREITP